jgi:hypothetical protein
VCCKIAEKNVSRVQGLLLFQLDKKVGLEFPGSLMADTFLAFVVCARNSVSEMIISFSS